jgi:hypothetical protein
MDEGTAVCNAAYPPWRRQTSGCKSGFWTLSYSSERNILQHRGPRN